MMDNQISSSSSTEAPQRQLKLPISRLLQPSGDDGSGSPARNIGDKHRVSHACEPCRSRKTKVRDKAFNGQCFPLLSFGDDFGTDGLPATFPRIEANSAAVKGAGNLYIIKIGSLFVFWLAFNKKKKRERKCSTVHAPKGWTSGGFRCTLG